MVAQCLQRCGLISVLSWKVQYLLCQYTLYYCVCISLNGTETNRVCSNPRLQVSEP